MDDSRKPDNSSPTKFPWQNEERSAEDLGATGVFGTSPELIDGSPGPVTQVGQEETSGERGELQRSASQAAVGREGLQEPIVHKVVLGVVRPLPRSICLNYCGPTLPRRNPPLAQCWQNHRSNRGRPPTNRHRCPRPDRRRGSRVKDLPSCFAL